MVVPAGADYCVKGSVLQSKLDALESLCGRPAVVSLQNRFRGRLPRRLNLLEWYPFGLLEEVLEDMREQSFDGKLARLSEIGEETARILLASTYRPLTTARSWTTFMSTAARLHSQYYNQGEMIVSFDAAGLCRVDLANAPRYAATDLHVAGGFYCGTASALGVSKPAYVFLTDDRGAHFEIRGEAPRTR